MAIHLSIMSYAGRVNRDLGEKIGIIESEFGTNGFVKFANGFQLVWAYVSNSSYGTRTITFYKPFANACIFVCPVMARAEKSGDGVDFAYNLSKTGCSVRVDESGFRYLAIGY